MEFIGWYDCQCVNNTMRPRQKRIFSAAFFDRNFCYFVSNVSKVCSLKSYFDIGRWRFRCIFFERISYMYVFWRNFRWILFLGDDRLWQLMTWTKTNLLAIPLWINFSEFESKYYSFNTRKLIWKFVIFSRPQWFRLISLVTRHCWPSR